MKCNEKITYIIILISLLIFNISFWIDHWSTSENASQGMWDLCFTSDDNGCCQSFPDRGHETPDWFVQFLWALYAAYISIAITCIICPYCVLLNEKNIEGKECMTVLLIASCFSSGCLYGDGVYFATEPSHASNDSLSVPDNSGVKYVYQCSVFVGTYCAGIKDMPEPPSCKQGFRYDSTVDNVNNPKIYVIYFDHQAFPMYLIKFKRSEVIGSRPANNIQPPHPVLGPRPRNNIQPPSNSGNVVLGPRPGNNIQPPHPGFKDKWEHTDRGDLQIVELKKDSCEYKEIETSFLQNNTGYQTIKISRIQNSKLYTAHMSFGNEFMKVAAKQHPRSYMKYLWHGTSESSTDNINEYGFNRNYKGKNACTYGDGVYFATDPSYSSQDKFSVPDGRGVKRVYQCSVFVGRYIKGERGIKEPPKDKDNVRYDSTVDDLNNPKIHVVFRDYQSYSQYLIEFKSI